MVKSHSFETEFKKDQLYAHVEMFKEKVHILSCTSKHTSWLTLRFLQVSPMHSP